MNFDTRTVMDLISLDEELKKKLHESIDEEFLLFDGDDRFTEETFAKLLTPILKDHIKLFIKYELKKMNLLIIKKTINIENIDYKKLIDYLTKN